MNNADNNEVKVILKKDDDEYNVIMYKSQEYINLRIIKTDSVNIWEEKFSFDNFKSYKVFSVADDLQEVYSALASHLEKKKFTIQKKENSIIIFFIFEIIKKNFICEFELKHLDNQRPAELFNEIFSNQKNMKQEIEQLKIENAKLKDEIEDSSNQREILYLLKDIYLEYLLIKKFEFDKKTVYCYKIKSSFSGNILKSLKTLIGKDWFIPDSADELNEIMINLYEDSNTLNLNGDEWIVTYGVPTDPNKRTIGKFPVSTQNYDKNEIYDATEKCDGTKFTVFRYKYPSFFNPNHSKGFRLYEDDDEDLNCTYAILCLQTIEN
jgi:hypothetical protein